ncbi:MAG: hypothetical protein Q8L16_12315 [Hydrogenophaga sp.]|nr:hypothetical protein [Hydrogenophaga sp.]
MSKNRHLSVLPIFLKGVAAVTSGTIVLKLAIFSLNATFARATDTEDASNIAKIIAFGFAWSAVLHFSSTRFIARTVLQGDRKGARLALHIALGLIVASLIFIALLGYVFSREEHTKSLFLATLFMAGSVAVFDLSTSLANALGSNKTAALGQSAMGTAIAICALGTLFNTPSFPNVSIVIIPFTALAIAFIVLWSMKEQLREPATHSIIRPPRMLSQLKNLLHFSLPGLIGAIFINPLVLWAVSSVAGVTGQEFVIFLVCQNLLGLVMLLPGQMNTAAFSILAKNSLSPHAGYLVLCMSLGSAIISMLAVYSLLPFAEPIYGDAFEKVYSVAPWFIAAAVPFVLVQFIATKMFLTGHPWVEAVANVAFGIMFTIGCHLLPPGSFELASIALLLFASHLLRAAIFFVVYKNY